MTYTDEGDRNGQHDRRLPVESAPDRESTKDA
jgi:hypothetical protein